LQALRTETPANAARWVGSLLHFVEDTGSKMVNERPRRFSS